MAIFKKKMPKWLFLAHFLATPILYFIKIATRITTPPPLLIDLGEYLDSTDTMFNSLIYEGELFENNSKAYYHYFLEIVKILHFYNF